MNLLKNILGELFKPYSTPEPINNASDYVRVKSWIKIAIGLYSFFSAVALVIIVIVFANQSFLSALPAVYVYTLMPFLILLTGWGYATILLLLPDVIKGIASSAKFGYSAGKQIETTHVQVTHDFGNRYTVRSYKENKGCLFAAIAGIFKLMLWAFFCIYIGPFLTFKKLVGSIVNVKKYTPT